VNHSVKKWKPVLHARNICVSSECGRFGTGRLSKYVDRLIGPVFFQGRPKDFDVPSALPTRKKLRLPFE
jgi:hypothetical protein